MGGKTAGMQEPQKVVALQVGYAWLNRPEVSATSPAALTYSANEKESRIKRFKVELTKYCIGVEIQVIQAERTVAVRNWGIEICINDGCWTR